MSLRAKVFIIVILLVLLGGGGFWIWNKYTGKYKIGADAIIGCQNSSAISGFFGSPGENLVTYNLFGHEVTVNQRITPFLDAVQKDVVDAKTGYSFNDVQTFNIRSKVSGGGQSLHSWGIAIDINPGNNPYELGNWGDPQTDIPGQIIDIFKKYGFAWGGDWAGQRDPMHFEWDGGQISGSFIDSQTQQKVIDVAAMVNNSGAPASGGDYTWTLESTHPHEVVIKAPGYEDLKFNMELFCFQNRTMDISLKPLPDNLAGSVSGKVALTGGRPPVIPATIYIDGKAVGASNVRGDYMIAGVRKGKHKIQAKVMFFPGATVETPDMKPGENVRNLNITIGG